MPLEITPRKRCILCDPLVIIPLGKRVVIFSEPWTNDVTQGPDDSHDLALTIASSNHALCAYTNVSPSAINVER